MAIKVFRVGKTLKDASSNLICIFHTRDILQKDDEFIIQLDPEFVDLRASIWGRDHALTVTALEKFVAKYMDGYLRAVATQVEPKE